MRKLEWRSPKEVLTGNTPGISMFKFHVWQKVYYLNPDVKIPRDNMLPGRFLGIAWNHGDSLCYFMRTEPTNKHSKPQILVRSVVKSTDEYKQEKNELTSPVTLNVERGLPPVSIQKNISDNM